MTARSRAKRLARVSAAAACLALLTGINSAGAVATSGAANAASHATGSWSADAPLLGIGSTGDAVRTWQGAMNEWLDVVAPEDTFRLEVDGDYGRLTDSITRRFQFSQGLPIDGLVGPVTRAAYLSAPELVEAGRTPVAQGPFLTPGDRGSAVADWQSALNRWLDAVGAGSRSLQVDGVYGPDTEATTRFFQQAQAVTVDGLVGPETQAALASAPALVNVAPAPPVASPDPAAPAAGVCPVDNAVIAEIVLGPDVPRPRCIIMSSDHWLRIVNQGDATHVELGTLELGLEPGATATSTLPVNAYVDAGVQTLNVSRYGGGTGPQLVIR